MSSVWSRVRVRTVLDVTEPTGALIIWNPRQNVFVGRVTGYLSLAMAREWIRVISELFVPGTAFDVFLDWEAMRGYDSESRRELTDWVISSRQFIRSARFLVLSRFVRMGVATANLATTLAGLSMEADGSRADFERAIEARLDRSA